MAAAAARAGLTEWAVPRDATRFRPFKYQRGPFRTESRALYRRKGPHAFGALHRASLIQLLLDAPEDRGGVGFNIRRRLAKGTIEGYLVLHDARELREIHDDFVLSRDFAPHKLDVRRPRRNKARRALSSCAS